VFRDGVDRAVDVAEPVVDTAVPPPDGGTHAIRDTGCQHPDAKATVTPLPAADRPASSKSELKNRIAQSKTVLTGLIKISIKPSI
jgi:hypothetical protein